MYQYIGYVEIRGVKGYMWLLGRRLYLKTTWRPRDTYYLGTLPNLLTAAARLKKLAPKPVDIRHALAAVAKALKIAQYIAERCRPSPNWKYMPYELKMAVEEATTLLTWVYKINKKQKPNKTHHKKPPKNHHT